MRTTEQLGFDSWHLGDHFFSVNQIDSIEPYLLLALAARGDRARPFRAFVTPVMFRPPSNRGVRLAAQLDILSGRTLRHGAGGGLARGRAHHLRRRLSLAEGALRPARRIHRGDESDVGRGARLVRWALLPPERGPDAAEPAAGRPTVLIAGGGEKRTLPLVASSTRTSGTAWTCRPTSTGTSASCSPVTATTSGATRPRSGTR